MQNAKCGIRDEEQTVGRGLAPAEKREVKNEAQTVGWGGGATEPQVQNAECKMRDEDATRRATLCVGVYSR